MDENEMIEVASRIEYAADEVETFLSEMVASVKEVEEALFLMRTSAAQDALDTVREKARRLSAAIDKYDDARSEWNSQDDSGTD